MTYTTLNEIKQPLAEFKKFDADTQLALLWYGYLDIKDQLNPAPPNDIEAIGKALYDKVESLSKEEQLQAQRDIANGAGTNLSKEYGALHNSAQLDFWLLLAQGMESGSIITVPDDYELPENTSGFVETVKGLDFEQRVNLTRNIVAEMGQK
ncbi:Orange carotenoid protein [Romeria aff. gracilis LEGE 07310]|uniref:Orange carotenoid protein n=1 Tax=Vasconcelosia minhoensis LEGE 07310 TaxID=915328 RepID=A0A8J7AXN9_9CYAN|nr:orange carotenoid protein N-terminal domain-containing protein [Romeria gracilis]MBE9077982.1 Orange carotenoid protein [Romeria aff. gracilis LEGE 07310]